MVGITEPKKSTISGRDKRVYTVIYGDTITEERIYLNGYLAF